MSFTDIVSKFNRQADSHSKSQSLNPFSEQFEQSRSPSPRFSREEYGKPVAGSKTDLRGRKAKTHICREILELCTVIHDVGTYNTKKRVPDDDDDDDQQIDDGTIIVSFGELFQIYTKISDKVVGLLIAAKRRGFVYFDREILFQRRDDDVLIALLKPMSEINKILKEDINQANSFATPVESKPVEKKKSPSSSKTKRVKPADDKSEQNESSTTAVDRPGEQTSPEVTDVNGIVPVIEMAEDRKPKCDLLTNGETIDVEKVIGCKNAEDDHNANCNGNNDDNNIVVVEEELLVSNVVEISENMDHNQCRSEDNNIVSEEGSIIVVVDAETAETGYGPGEADDVVENKSEIAYDSLAADDEVRPEVENVRDETRVEINKTVHTDDGGGRVEDVTEESANVVDNGNEKNDNIIVITTNGGATDVVST